MIGQPNGTKIPGTNRKSHMVTVYQQTTTMLLSTAVAPNVNLTIKFSQQDFSWNFLDFINFLTILRQLSNSKTFKVFQTLSLNIHSPDFEPPSEVWRKPRGRPRNSWVRTVTNDLANFYTGLPEAREAAQDRVYWRMFTKQSATHS